MSNRYIKIFDENTLSIYGKHRKNSDFKLAIEEICSRPDCVKLANDHSKKSISDLIAIISYLLNVLCTCKDERNVEFGEWEVSHILDKRVRNGITEFLVHWTGFDRFVCCIFFSRLIKFSISKRVLFCV